MACGGFVSWGVVLVPDQSFEKTNSLGPRGSQKESFESLAAIVALVVIEIITIKV